MIKEVVKGVEMTDLDIEVDPSELDLESKLKVNASKKAPRKIQVSPLKLKKTIDLANYKIVNEHEKYMLEKLTRYIDLQESSIS